MLYEYICMNENAPSDRGNLLNAPGITHICQSPPVTSHVEGRVSEETSNSNFDKHPLSNFRSRHWPQTSFFSDKHKPHPHPFMITALECYAFTPTKTDR